MAQATVDRIKVQCTKCKNSFRERVRNLRSGYQAQCPNCSRMITFDEGSDDLGVRGVWIDGEKAFSATH